PVAQPLARRPERGFRPAPAPAGRAGAVRRRGPAAPAARGRRPGRRGAPHGSRPGPSPGPRRLLRDAHRRSREPDHEGRGPALSRRALSRSAPRLRRSAAARPRWERSRRAPGARFPRMPPLEGPTAVVRGSTSSWIRPSKEAMPMSRALTTAGAMLALALLAAPALGAAPQPGPPLAIVRVRAPITIDGDLSDPGWKEVQPIGQWYETRVGDSVEPQVRNV